MKPVTPRNRAARQLCRTAFSVSTGGRRRRNRVPRPERDAPDDFPYPGHCRGGCGSVWPPLETRIFTGRSFTLALPRRVRLCMASSRKSALGNPGIAKRIRFGRVPSRKLCFRLAILTPFRIFALRKKSTEELGRMDLGESRSGFRPSNPPDASLNRLC